MQKTVSTLVVLTALLFTSCSNEPAETKKEVIVVSKPAVVVKETVKKPTTIVLDKNGVKVEAKKVDVTIKNK